MDSRPTVFVGSSAEGIAVLEAIQVLLEHPCEVVPWTAIFAPGEFTLESLDLRIDQFDFAILVLTADDILESRGTRFCAPRDNLILEVGLCMGRLGRKRTFIVSDRTVDLKLPSDLAGINCVTYQPPSTGTMQSALGAPCIKLKNAFAALGQRIRSNASVAS